MLLGACSKDDGTTVRSTGAAGGTGAGSASATPVCDPFGNAAKADTTVNAALTEYSVTLARTSIRAGLIHFAIENRGADVHEFVVVKADSIGALPRMADGTLDEAKLPKGAVIGEVEGFPAGETCDGTFQLARGRYVALCNISETENGKTVAHLAEGMAAAFTVIPT